MSMFERP